MKVSISIILLLISTNLKKCTNDFYNKQNNIIANKNTVDTTNSLIQKYEIEAVRSKGKLTYFIPKDEVNWYFSKGRFISIDSAMFNDNVCFFDSIGNIVYQAIVIKHDNHGTYISCLDLTKIRYYTMPLNVDSIKDLSSGYKYSVKIFRSH